MAAPRPVNRLAQTDAAYIAGLVDGEGTITLTRLHRNENRRLVLSISNTETALLRYVLSSIGAGKITSKRRYRTNHSPGFAYCITSRQALDVLKQILPHLRSYKKERAALALRSYLQLTPRNGRYTQQMRSAREAFEADLLDIRPS